MFDIGIVVDDSIKDEREYIENRRITLHPPFPFPPMLVVINQSPSLRSHNCLITPRIPSFALMFQSHIPLP